jgi:hypothetical protein
MTFTRPEALFLLLLLLPVLVWSRRSGGAALARGATALRLLALALVIAAFARPVLLHEDEPVYRVVVADVSDSMGPLGAVQAAVDRVVAEAAEDEVVRLVSVAANAREERAHPRRDRDFPPLTREGTRGAIATSRRSRARGGGPTGAGSPRGSRSRSISCRPGPPAR